MWQHRLRRRDSAVVDTCALPLPLSNVFFSVHVPSEAITLYIKLSAC
jgi:hypothetical protein